MNFRSVYSTRDQNEVSILEDLFSKEGINYEVRSLSAAPGGDSFHKNIFVDDKDRDKAHELLEQTGFSHNLHSSKGKKVWSKKLILIFLALLILVIVAVVIAWFMNVE